MANEQEIESRPFATYIEDDRYSPHREIVRKIDEKLFPFNRNKFFTYNPAKLGADEFNRCVELYTERLPNGGSAQEAFFLMQEIMQEERPNAEELQDLAIDLVRKLYNVPDSVNLKAMLEQKDIDGEGSGGEQEDELSDEKKEELQPEIEKRRILNTITHGASVFVWSTAYFLASEELNNINPNLLDMYNRVSALVNYWNWKFNVQEMMEAGQMPMTQGMNKVDTNKKEIEASGINFPVLIHELSKGVIEYMSVWGKPNLPDEELRFIYKEADKYAHECWHYYFGPTLWRAILNTADTESQNLPTIIMNMAKMDYVDLSNFCIDIVFHPENLGKKQMENLKK